MSALFNYSLLQFMQILTIKVQNVYNMKKQPAITGSVQSEEQIKNHSLKIILREACKDRSLTC